MIDAQTAHRPQNSKEANRNDGCFMKLKSWNIITAISIAVIVVGLVISKINATIGRIVLLIGCIVFLGTIIGITCHNKKKPLRCPHCGEILPPMGRRYRGGIYHIDALDAITCLHCGAVVSSDDYLKSE